MSVRILGFTADDWFNSGLLMLGEGAIAWLAINLLIRPGRDSTGGISAATVAMLMIVATVVPRVCHDRGIWGTLFAIVVLVAVLLSTALAVHQTSFPSFALTDQRWIDETLDALIRRPSVEEVPVWTVILSSGAIWWRGVMRGRPDIDTGLAMLRVGSAALIGLVAAHALVDHGFSDRQASAAVLVFFTGTLLAVAMMRQELVPWRATIRWLETVLLPVALIIGPTAILIGLLTRDLSGMVELLLDPVIYALTIFLRIISFILVIIAMIILVPLVWLFSKLPFSAAEPSEQTPIESARSTVTAASEAGSSLPDAFRYLVAALLIFLIFAGLVKFRLRLGLVQVENEEDRQSARVEGSLLDGLKNWFGQLRGGSDGDDVDALNGTIVRESGVKLVLGSLVAKVTDKDVGHGNSSYSVKLSLSDCY